MLKETIEEDQKVNENILIEEKDTDEVKLNFADSKDGLSNQGPDSNRTGVAPKSKPPISPNKKYIRLRNGSVDYFS